MKILWPAARQYRHSNSDRFVRAYDKKETEKIVTGLLKDRTVECARCHCLFIPGGRKVTEVCAGCYEKEVENLKKCLAAKIKEERAAVQELAAAFNI